MKILRQFQELPTPKKLVIVGGAVALIYIFSQRKALVAAARTLLDYGATGKKNMDAQLLPMISDSVARLFPNDPRQKEIIRAMMAIANNESGERKSYYGIVGDKQFAGGPSIGPLQVYRTTAIGSGFVPKGTTPDQYVLYSNDLQRIVDWGVQVFKDVLNYHKGDFAKAIKSYNGGPRAAPGGPSDVYRDKALAFIESIWGNLSA